MHAIQKRMLSNLILKECLLYKPIEDQLVVYIWFHKKKEHFLFLKNIPENQMMACNGVWITAILISQMHYRDNKPSNIYHILSKNLVRILV